MGDVVTPVKAAGVQWQELDDEILVFDGELLQRLVGSAAAIWRSIDDVRSTEQIVGDLSAAFGSGPQLAQDVPAFLAELEGAGLIRLEAAAPGRFSVPATVAWDRDGARVVLADLRTGTRTALSDTATLIWQLAGAGLTSQEILEELSAAFPDAPNSLPADVASALEELVTHGWLRDG